MVREQILRNDFISQQKEWEIEQARLASKLPEASEDDEMDIGFGSLSRSGGIFLESLYFDSWLTAYSRGWNKRGNFTARERTRVMDLASWREKFSNERSSSRNGWVWTRRRGLWRLAHAIYLGSREGRQEYSWSCSTGDRLRTSDVTNGFR